MPDVYFTPKQYETVRRYGRWTYRTGLTMGLIFGFVFGVLFTIWVRG